MPDLIILAGLPGAGKSTFAKTFFEYKYAIISSDDIRKRLAGSLREAHEQQLKPWDVFYQEIASRLRHRVDVVADATFLTPRHRRRALGVAEAHGADTHLILFQNHDVAMDRNADRAEADRVPDTVMDGMLDLYHVTLAEIAQESYTTVTKIKAFT